MMKRIWEEGKTRQALSLEQAHRLTGKSEFLLRNGTMRGVRLETFYQGKSDSESMRGHGPPIIPITSFLTPLSSLSLGTYHETYYVILRPPGPRGQAKGIQWRIHRHTLPSFIPLRRLERTWMGKNEKVSDVLMFKDSPNPPYLPLPPHPNCDSGCGWKWMNIFRPMSRVGSSLRPSDPPKAHPIGVSRIFKPRHPFPLSP